MTLDPSFARAVSRRNFADWIAAGASFERALKKLLRQAHVEIQTGRPPTKVVKKTLDQLIQLMKQSGLPGEVQETGGRRHEVTICMPEAAGDTVSFVLVSGSINGRNGLINLTRRRVLDASKHVLERLHQRLGTKDSAAVLREVFSCLAAAVSMGDAAQVAGAQHWPLVTTNGLFVGAPSETKEVTVLITWMRFDQLGKKWGRVADHLLAASSVSTRLLEDRDFCVGLIRLHPWLLRPHAPGPDLAAMWWASRPVSERDEDVREFEKSLAEQDGDSAMLIDDEIDSASTSGEVEPRSAHLAIDSAGPPHVVKAREQYTGIVVQLRSTGTRIIALQNGTFGVLRQGDHVVDGAVGGSVAALQLGARVTVEVLRVIGSVYTGPHTVVLQLSDVADAKWLEVMQRHPLGAMVSGSIVWRGTGGSIIGMTDGSSGWLPDGEISWLRDDPSVRDSLAVGQSIRLRVVGYAPKRRQLLLSLRQVDGHPFDRIDEATFLGTTQRGVVSNVNEYGVFVKLPVGADALLHRSEMPDGLSPSKGDVLVVQVVGMDKERRRVALKFVQGVA